MDTQDLLSTIFRMSGIDALRTNPYLPLFVSRLQAHLKRLVKLFDDSRGQMEDPTSASRRELNKETLVASHMLAELKMVFPDGRRVARTIVGAPLAGPDAAPPGSSPTFSS